MDKINYQLALLLAVVLLAGASEPLSATYPCNYSDTVNITESLRLKDGSYSYAGLIVPANLIAEYNFKVVDGIEYPAVRHIRGCICSLKPCINFCCPPHFVYDPAHSNCTSPQNVRNLPTVQNAHIEITLLNQTEQIVNIQEKFVIRTEFGCRNKFVGKNQEQFWTWNIFENGTLMRDGRIWSNDEYCFTPLERKQLWTLTPLICERFQRGYRVWIYAICTILAIFTNVFVFSILVSVKEARESHYSQLILHYLVSVIIGYLFLVYLALKNPTNLSHNACRRIGFLAYFCIMLSFGFLALCSLDFLLKFNNKSIKSWTRKFLYILVILLVLALRYLVSFAQNSGLPRQLKPGIGDVYCWFDVRLWGILFYYYIPIVALLSFSLICCLKSYLVMWNLPADTVNVAGIELHTIKTHFHAFFVYLLIAFSVWVREMIVYVTARLREHFFIIDFWSGVCIFALAITGFIYLLGQNLYVKAWWATNVESSQSNLSLINAKMYTYSKNGVVSEPLRSERQELVTAL